MVGGGCYHGWSRLLPCWVAIATMVDNICCDRPSRLQLGAWRPTSPELDAAFAGARCRSGAKLLHMTTGLRTTCSSLFCLPFFLASVGSCELFCTQVVP